MAASASSTSSIFHTLLTQPPRLSPRGACTQVTNGSKSQFRLPNTTSSRWSAVKLHDRFVKFVGKPMVAKPSLHKRAAFVRCATIEEIQAEKALVENDVKQRLEKTIDTMRTNFNSIRTGRANPSMLDRVEVDYYGAPVSLKSIAQINTPDASSLLISPFDKSSLKAIEKAIVTSELGITPNNDGEVIRLFIPQLTSDRRKELSKVVSKLTEEAKIAMRNVRRDALKAYEKLEKDKKISEDNLRDLSKDLQKLIDEYIKKVDSIYKQKEQELLKV